MRRACIGTSGWTYDSWKNGFYEGIPRKGWLRFCAERFTAVETNGTFYRLRKRETLERWREQTPDDFAFALKANRFLTHNKKLLDPEISLRLEREAAEGLGRKLAVVLWQ